MAPPDAEALGDIDTSSRSQKEKFLKQYSEDDFRDLVLRPIYERKGLAFIRDNCGPTEEGKDCFFSGKDLLGRRLIYSVQTKAGNLNLSSSAKDNLVNAIAQLRTALSTPVLLSSTKEKVPSDFVILYASGRINDQARTHIIESVNDTRLSIYDANDLIPEIDLLYPELWHGIDAQKFPYFKHLKAELLSVSDTFSLGDLNGAGHHLPITDETFVALYVHRFTPEITTVKGQVTRTPKLEEFPISEILEKRTALVVISGEGGSGKTTALRRLAYTVVEKALRTNRIEYIPVFLKAPDLARDGSETLISAVSEATARMTPNGKPCFDAKDLASGAVVVLIDALDEVPTDERRLHVLNKVRDFGLTYPRCKVIVTSRENSFLQTNPQASAFIRYRLSPLGVPQACKIATTIMKGRKLPDEAAHEMLRRLQDVHGLDLSPLLVTVFVATSDFSKKDIPANITEIFKKFTEQMLGRWDERKGISQQYHAPLKDFLLQQLAFVMHTERITTIPLSRCKTIFTEELEKRGHEEADVSVILNEILYRSNLLKVDGDEASFRHHLIQEFFAGRGAPSADFFKGILADEWWRKALLFYFGDHPKEVASLAKIATIIESMDPVTAYHATISVGFALQACYLSEMGDKVALLESTIERLAACKEGFLADFSKKAADKPYTAFLTYYMYGKDAVGCDPVTRVIEKLKIPASPKEGEADPKAELKVFWVITGLLESGHLDRAEELIRKFHPNEVRLLLAIHMSCMFISKLRVSTVEQRKIADRLFAELTPKVEPFTQAALKEFKALLLEVRQGNLEALEPPKPEAAP